MNNDAERSAQLLTGFKAVVDRLESKDNGILKNHPNSFINFDSMKASFIEIESAESFKHMFKGMCLKTLKLNPSYTIVHKHALRMFIFGLHVILEELAFDYEEDKRPCTTCQEITFPDKTLLCDCCNDPYHTFCLRSPIEEIPQGTWFCHECSVLEQNYLLQKAISQKERKEIDLTNKQNKKHGRTLITLGSSSEDSSSEERIKKKYGNKTKSKPTRSLFKDRRKKYLSFCFFDSSCLLLRYF